MDRPFSDYRLPPGRHGLPREFVRENQRWRLLGATAEALATDGYSALTTAAIAKAAGISPRTVYQHLGNVDACVLAAYRMAADSLLGILGATDADESSALTPLDVALRLLALEPALVSLLGLAAPATLASERRRLSDRLAARLRGLAPVSAPVAAAQRWALAGALGLLSTRVRAGEAERLPELIPELVEVLYLPFENAESTPRPATRGARWT